MQLSVKLDLSDDLTPVGFEGGPEVVDPNIRQLGHQPVGDKTGKASGQPVVPSLHSPPADDVVPLFHLGNKTRNLRRVMLQVTIHCNDDLAVRKVKSSLQRSSLAEISSQTDKNGAGIAVADLDQRFVAQVLASVVHKDHLER